MEPNSWAEQCLIWKAYSERPACVLGCSQMEDSKGHRRGFRGPMEHLRTEGQEREGRKAGQQFIPVQPLRHITVSPRASLLPSEGSKDLRATFPFPGCHFQLARGSPFPLTHWGATCSFLALRKAQPLVDLQGSRTGKEKPPALPNLLGFISFVANGERATWWWVWSSQKMNVMLIWISDEPRHLHCQVFKLQYIFSELN